MDEVNIYTYTTIQGPKKRAGIGMFILETITSKGEATFTKQVELEPMTEHQAELFVLCKAMEKLKRCCQINIHTQSQFVSSAVTNGWVETWHKNGWKNSKKQDVANAEEWQKMLNLLNNNVFSFKVCEKHKYLNWMKNELAKAEKEKKDV